MREPYFRPNVGIVLLNREGDVFWGQRINRRSVWQFPQGGILPGESMLSALFRELEEEVGLSPDAVEVKGSTRHWFYYEFPPTVKKPLDAPHAVGQKQKWFLLQLKKEDSAIDLDTHGEPEFSDWKWVPYWYPIGAAASFKKKIYQQALSQLRVFVPDA